MDNEIVSSLKLYEKFKRVSIAEFFEKNRHLLGFENPKKSLLIAVKELVDNSLDACEEYNILPDITVSIEKLENETYKVTVEDNGPGIPYDKVPDIYGSFLFGSKFHRYISSRGKQGIGASAVVLYGQLTTMKPVYVITKTPDSTKAIYYEIKIDVANNKPETLKQRYLSWDKDHGTSVTVYLKGQYTKGKQSVDEYIQLTALANPHTTITYYTPNGEKIVYKRITDKVPELKEIKPHPYGIEIGVLERMLKNTKHRTLIEFLSNEFSSIGRKTAEEILKKARLENKDPKELNEKEIERLYVAIHNAKIRSIPANVIVTLGEDLIRRSLMNTFNPEFVTAIKRKPAVYRGNPFIVEVGIAYGGNIDEFRILRFANRVPLLYKAGECAITLAAKEINWKRYGFNAEEGSLPKDPAVVLVHVASVWIPFTSESKEAIAAYPEILKEIELGIKQALRDIYLYISKKKSIENISSKYKTLYGYGLEVARSLSEMLNIKENEIEDIIKERIRKELFNDIMEILLTVREIKSLLKENKDNEAVRLIKNMLSDVIKSKIVSEKELTDTINEVIKQVKEKKLHLTE